MPIYDQAFIDVNLEGAQKVHQIVEDFIEGLNVKWVNFILFKSSLIWKIVISKIEHSTIYIL